MSSTTLRNALLGLLLLSLAVLAAMPWVVGRNVEQVAITNTMALIPPEIQSQIEIRESSFTNGWFRSAAELELEYLPLGGLPLLMRLDMQIQHGPILFTPAGPKLGLVYANIDPRFDSAEIREALLELPFDLPDVLLELQVELNGEMRVGMQIAPISHSDANGEFEFAGVDAHLIAYTDGSAEIDLTMGALNAREYSSNFQLAIDGMSMQATSDQINDMLGKSAASLSLPGFRSTAPVAFEVLNVELESRVQPSRLGADHTDWYQRTQVGHIKSELPVSRFSWTSEINETRSDLFRRYYELMVEIQEEMNANGGLFTETVTQSAEEFALLLLRNTIVLNNAIAATAYDGEHTLDLRIHWRGLPDMTDLARLDMNEMLAAVDLTFDMALDLEAILRSPLAEMVDPYVQQGYLQLDNGRILMRAEIKDSEFSINGQRRMLDEVL